MKPGEPPDITASAPGAARCRGMSPLGEAAQPREGPGETAELSEYSKLEGDERASHPWRWGEGPAVWGAELRENRTPSSPPPKQLPPGESCKHANSTLKTQGRNHLRIYNRSRVGKTVLGSTQKRPIGEHGLEHVTREGSAWHAHTYVRVTDAADATRVCECLHVLTCTENTSRVQR